MTISNPSSSTYTFLVDLLPNIYPKDDFVSWSHWSFSLVQLWHVAINLELLRLRCIGTRVLSCLESDESKVLSTSQYWYISWISYQYPIRYRLYNISNGIANILHIWPGHLIVLTWHIWYCRFHKPWRDASTNPQILNLVSMLTCPL